MAVTAILMSRFMLNLRAFRREDVNEPAEVLRFVPGALEARRKEMTPQYRDKPWEYHDGSFMYVTTPQLAGS